MSGAGSHTEADIPVHAPAAELSVADGQSYLTAPGAEPVALDAMALALWELCDGETTVAEMAEAAAAIFDAPDARLRDDILTALETLAAHQLLTWQK